MARFSVTNTTRRPAPRGAFLVLASSALPGWDISLVFVGKTRARALNKKLRRKTYVPNVLSYEVGKKSGEILICLDRLEIEAPWYELSPSDFCSYLFIHGLMHLKGYPHGPTMERYERELMSRFVHPRTRNEKKTPRNRNRHRNTPRKSGGR